MKENFVPSIVNFNTEDITDGIRKIFARDYLSNPEYTYDRIYRANVACGPTVKWVIAQLEYAELLNRMDPLRQEPRAQEEAAVIKKNEASRRHELTTTLEATNNHEKEEYSGHISQTRALLAVQLVTLTRVYYLLAGPRLAEALDFSTVVPHTGSACSTPKPPPNL